MILQVHVCAAAESPGQALREVEQVLDIIGVRLINAKVSYAASLKDGPAWTASAEGSRNGTPTC